MDNTKKALIVLVILLASLFLILIWRYYAGIPKIGLWYSYCRMPTNTGEYTICCNENNTGVDCSDNTLFECGKEINVALKLDFNKDGYYWCINRNILEDDWGGGMTYGSNSIIECVPGDISSSIFFWRGKIPYIESNFTIADVYLIQSESIPDYDELIYELDHHEKVIEIHGEIKC